MSKEYLTQANAFCNRTLHDFNETHSQTANNHKEKVCLTEIEDNLENIRSILAFVRYASAIPISHYHSMNADEQFGMCLVLQHIDNMLVSNLKSLNNIRKA